VGRARDGATIWANLVHLGANLWADRVVPGREDDYICYRPHLRCETEVWNELLARMAARGLTMVVIDLADGVRYDSHPEIAVRRAWSPTRLRRELARIRRLGIEPVPKLNFSACHDAWLGPYARCVSTDAYYAVCRDLIAETAELFGRPRLFHLGMDEETAPHQQLYEHVVVRQHDLWWRDLRFLLREVERSGARPWVWSDCLWHHPETFLERMPRSVLQSNWYYGESFSVDPRRNRAATCVRAYLDLEEHGYDQVPTGSNHSCPENLERTVAFCRRRIDPRRLHGFLQTGWRPTQARYRRRLVEAVDRAGRARGAALPT
jgi:hypothetical protein